MPADKLKSVNVREAAEILGTTPGTMRQMLQAGVIHGYKTGTCGPKSQWRVSLAEIERFQREGANANA